MDVNGKELFPGLENDQSVKHFFFFERISLDLVMRKRRVHELRFVFMISSSQKMFLRWGSGKENSI